MDMRDEVIITDSAFPFDICERYGIPDGENVGESLYLHRHNCLELNYVESGDGYNLFSSGKYELHPGELFLINNREYHHAVNTDRLVLKVIVFDADLIWKNNPFDYLYLRTFFEWGHPQVRHMSRDSLYIHRVRKIIHTLETEWSEKRSGYKMMIKSLLLELLALIYRSACEESGFRDETRSFDKNYEKLKPVLEYISLHYSEDMNLSMLSRKAYLNPNYFSVIFRETMHTTLSNYIQRVRIRQACRLLLETDQGMAEIAASCGFHSISYFNKIFRHTMGCAPGEYRKNPYVF